MANQITDGRTVVDAAEATTNWVDLGGTGAGTLDSEIFFEGSNSIAYSTASSVGGLLYNAGSAQDWSSQTFYFLVNCGIVGLLATKANSGLTIRFCGATITDWFEVDIAGSDSWPASIAGGWTPFVVDIETAHTNASRTNGTKPGTNAIQYVGISTITGGTMPRMVDNTWIDAIHRLPDGTAGILVEGRNGGATDWNWADVIGASDTGAWATARTGPGGSVVLSTPVQIGINDTSTHGFDDTNVTILWDNQEFLPDDLYKISALGNSGGTTNVTAGIKAGTGAAATGSQGWSIVAAALGARWSLDMNDPNLDAVGLFGCAFQHGDIFSLDDVAVDVATCLFLDCTSAAVHNASVVRASIVDANTADGVAFMSTDDMGDIAHSSFIHSDGHAIELDAATPTAQNNVGNLFSGYTNTEDSTDAAIVNTSTGAITISSSAGSDLQTNSFRNTSTGDITILNNISVTLTGMKDNTEVRVLDDTTKEFLAGIENATAGTVDNRSFTFSLAASLQVDIAIFNTGFILPPNNRIENFIIPTSDGSIPISQIRDRNYVNL